MGSKKKYKINKQTTYLLLYYQEINMVHKQNKEKTNERKKTFITREKKKQNNPTHTNSQNSECGHLFSHKHTTTHSHILKQNLTLTHSPTHVT